MSQPTFDPNDNNAYLVYIPSAVFVVVCPLLMGLRIWARLKKGGGLGADDIGTDIHVVNEWLSRSVFSEKSIEGAWTDWTCTPKRPLTAHVMTTERQYFFMAQVTYKAAINLVKCCILLLYLRLFQVVRWFRLSCWGLLAIVGMYCAASIAATIFQCTPVIRAFDKDTPGHCIDTAKFWFANAGFSIATDIIILLLPMPLVWKLEVPRTQKVALIAIFAVGIFVVVTSCKRFTTLDLFATSPDNTYKIENVMWTIIEPNIAVICSCLPILRPLVIRFIPGLRSKSSKNQGASGTYGTQGSTPGYYTSGPSSTTDKAHVRQELRRTEEEQDWVELDGVKSSRGVHLASVGRPSSQTGSEEDMLVGRRANGPSAAAPDELRVQKTVEYSVQYSKDKEHM